MNKLTIFTPVFNRRKELERLYKSLQKQTDKDFEWIIVDDGSTENNYEQVVGWIRENKSFPISYHYVTNGGKHRAINLAVKIAKGKAFFIVDSDDYLAPCAVQFINSKFNEILSKDDIAGISGMKCHFDGKYLGLEPLIDTYKDLFQNERKNYNLNVDLAEVYKTEILKKYPFPEFKNENFLSEGIVHNKISLDGYRIRYYKEKIYFCEYRKDGLSFNREKNFEHNPKGWAANIRMHKKSAINNSNQIEFLYILKFKQMFDEKTLCELLDISMVKYQQYIFQQEELKKNISLFLEKNSIHKICIYGMGTVFEIFKHMINKSSDIEIKYGIDRNPAKLEMENVFSINDDLPQNVDSLIITPNNLTKEEIAFISQKVRGKVPNISVYVLKEIDKVGTYIYN